VERLSDERLEQILATVTTVGRLPIPPNTPCFWDDEDRVACTYDDIRSVIVELQERREVDAREVGRLREELARLQAALETVTRSHPNLVTRGGGPAPWLVAKAALLNMPLRYGDDFQRDRDAVVAEWAKSEPSVRR